METIKQTVRPKHQVLILKCYPRLPKNSSLAEIKPNGSELSYLLYYASSRRSKLSKVGAFLEKKTAHDLWKQRTAAVQITLQILTAFLNNPAIGGAGPTGFGLFAPYILRILRDVLRDANEAILVESAVPTFDSFCRHQDHVALNADVEFRTLFSEVVSLWAGYATKEQVQQKTVQRRGKMRVGFADSVKIRMAGLHALKSTADSDTLGTEAGRQLGTVMPVILQNLYDGDGDLDETMQLNAEMEAQEKEKSMRPRPSMMTMREALGGEDEEGDARAAATTVDEADRIADQEASLLALRCLKSVFSFENRALVRTATNCVLRFIVAHRPNPIKFEKTQSSDDSEDQWAVQLFKTVCVWTPVQDRFVAIFSAVEMLIHSNVAEDDLYRQLLLTRIISRVLSSDTTLIGLSVMDVLLGLLQHMLRILQSGTANAAGRTGDDTHSANDSHHSSTDSQKQVNGAGAPVIDTEQRKSPIRVRLLHQLQQCVSNLAVHVYYTDQIGDMISAILLRLKPSPINSNNLQIPHTVSSQPSGSIVDASRMFSVATDEFASPARSDTGITSNSSPRGARLLAAGFSFATPTARETALLAISRILTTSNRPTAGNEQNYVSTHRNPVPLHVWEGSTWLLRDPDVGVRAAFVKAFRTWLRLEFPRLELEKSMAEDKKLDKERKRKSLNTDLARRAASTASAKKAASKRNQTAVLQSIHVAVVDALADLPAPEEKAEPEPEPEPPQAFDLGEALDAITPGCNGFPLSVKEEVVPAIPPAQVLHNELSVLNEELTVISTRLSLLPLDDFRALLVPSVPSLAAHPPSPRNGSGSSAGGRIDEENDSSNDGGGGGSKHGQGGLNGVRKNHNRSPGPGQIGAAVAGRFDRYDFALPTDAQQPHQHHHLQNGLRVVGLKRASADGGQSRSASLGRTTVGGVGSGSAAKRAASYSAQGSKRSLSHRGGASANGDEGEDGNESDSLVEFEGSWWGTSMVGTGREGGGGQRRDGSRGARDLGELLEGIDIDVREGGGGLGRAPGT